MLNLFLSAKPVQWARLFDAHTKRLTGALVATLLVQQAIVASSTFWMTLASESVDDTVAFSAWLACVGASLVVPLFPAALAARQLEDLRLSLTKNYALRFAEVHSSPGAVLSTQDRGHKEPYLLGEAGDVLGEGVYFLSDTLALILNVLLNVVVLSTFVSTGFSTAYAVSALFLGVGTFALARGQSRFTNLVIGRSLSLRTLLSRGWSSVSLGNEATTALWKQRAEAAGKELTIAQKAETSRREVLSVCITLASATPIAFVFVVSVLAKDASTATLVALLATAPRHLQTIQHMDALVKAAFRWASFRTRVRGLSSSLEAPGLEASLEESASRVRCADLRLHFADATLAPTSVAHAIALLSQRSRGRVLVTGPNGSGKSTLLRILKVKDERPTFLLPAGAELETATSTQGLSTGERWLQVLADVQHVTSAGSVLFLDEWDANLDGVRVAEVEAQLDALAQQRLIVEVRHMRSAS